MNHNINPDGDWTKLVLSEIKNLDQYIVVDQDQQWSDFQKKME